MNEACEAGIDESENEVPQVVREQFRCRLAQAMSGTG